MKQTILFLLFLLFAGQSFADTWTTSIISSNTTWVKENASGDGVYVIDLSTDSLMVAAGVTLTIEPGVTVKFHDDVRLVVYGTLVAEGTETDSIRFIVDDAAGSATEWGGIKLLGDGTANKLIFCRIEKGDADSSSPYTPLYTKNGGGVYCDILINQQTEIKHSVITGNRALQSGGGIYCRGGASPVIAFNRIARNYAGNSGGGIAASGIPGYVVQPAIQTNFIYENTANGLGGGGVAFLGSSNTSLYNNLIYDNAATNGSGGGLFVAGMANQIAVRNTILRNNSASSNNQIGGTPDVQYSNIEGGFSGTGNSGADPLFNDPANFDFHYEANSPLVDAGINAGAPTSDFDGNARPFDGDRNGTATSDIGMFEYQNTIPVITSTPVLTVTEETAYSYQVTAEDPDVAETLTFSLIQAPPFLEIDDETGLISGTPMTDDDGGDHTVTVQVSDLNDATGQQTFTLNVTTINDPLIVGDITDQNIEEGDSFAAINLDEFVTDEETPDAGIGWTYSGNTDLVVSIGTDRIATVSAPNADWYGSETITFTATDGGGLQAGDAATFTITNINDAPVISAIEDQNTPEGSPFDAIALDDFVNDVDHADTELTWTYSGNSAMNVVIDANRLATVTPVDENFNGAETITFKAADPAGLADSVEVLFTVTPVNDAPVVTDIPNQTIAEGAAFATINLDDYVQDVDNDDHEMTWTYNGNTDLTVSVSAGRVATIGIPDADWNGLETIVFTATDPGNLAGSDEVVFTVINVNDNPLAVNDTISTDEDQPVNVQALLNDSDIDEDALEILEVTDPANGSATIQSGTSIRYTPDQDFSGSDSFDYTVIDNNGGESSATVYITVNPVNDAPVVSDITDQTIDEGGSFASINLDDYVADVDNADADLQWTYSGNNNLIVNIDENRTATIAAPDTNWNGFETITFTVGDPGELSDSDEVVFTVNNVNDAPVAVNDTIATDEDNAVDIAVLTNDSDIDEDNLEVAGVTVPAHGTAVIQNGSTVLYTPVADYFGSDTFSYTVTDNQGGETTASVFVNVLAVNDAPVLNAFMDQNIQEGQSFASFDLDTLVMDVDNEITDLFWSFTGNNELDIAIDENNLVTIAIPTDDWNGSESVRFKVSDPAGLEDSADVVFTVTGINDPPVLSAIENQTEEEGTNFMPVFLDNYVEDVDDADETLTWSASGETALLVTIDENRVATVSAPDENWNGSETIQFKVTDPAGASDSVSVIFTWTPVNDPPVLTQIPDQTIDEGGVFLSVELDEYVDDPDNADSALVWTWSGQSELEVSVDSGRVATFGIPGKEWSGSETITFKVSDADGLADSIQVVLTVEAVNDPPAITGDLPELSFAEDDSLAYALSNWFDFVADIDHPDTALYYFVVDGMHVSALPMNPVALPKDNFYTFKASQDWFGLDTLTLIVSDGALDDTSAFFIYVKPVNDPPAISGLPESVTFDNDTTVELLLADRATDIDSPVDALNWRFSVSNDSIEFTYHVENKTLILAAPGFAGEAELICTVTDDSSASVTDTITVIVQIPTALEALLAEGVPTKFDLYQNYPNPFNPLTTIKFAVPKAGKIQIEVFNIVGQKVMTLFDGEKKPGYHTITFNANGLSSGMYFYKIQAERYQNVKKMILMK